MNNQKKYWQVLTLPFNEQLYDALQQQHHAAGNLALAGRFLIPQQPDDSNTNMRYLLDKETLSGNELTNGLHLGLQLSRLELQVLNQDEELIDAVGFDGKTTDEAFDAMKELLQDAGNDISKISNELHFEIPFHPVVDGVAFDIKESKYFKENALYRHNSEIVMHDVISSYPDAALVRVWPHHFDTGTFIPIENNEQGVVSKSIGLGWAIPDKMVNEPYFYLTFWLDDAKDAPQNLERLPAGEWMMPTWNGAILKHSDILQLSSAEKQYGLVKSFFESGIHIIRQNLSKDS